jgi:hypothetical protein
MISEQKLQHPQHHPQLTEIIDLLTGSKETPLRFSNFDGVINTAFTHAITY